MPVAIVAAAVGAAGAVGSAVISSNAAHNAASQAANAAAKNNALQSSIYNSNKELIQPSVNRGNAAGDLESAFLGIGGDPAKSKAALDTFLGSTGYQFTKDQGVSAINQSKATAGLLNSGSTLKSLDAYGTGLANSFGQQYVSNLDSISKQGTGAAESLAGTGQNYANAVSQNNNNAAVTAGNAGIAGANAITNSIGQALSAYGTFRGQSSYTNPAAAGGAAPSAATNAFAGG